MDATAASFLRGDWDGCVNWSRQTGEAIEDYFYGGWMEQEPHDDGTIDPQRWFHGKDAMNWAHYFDNAVPWVAVGRKWDLLDRLMQFPTASLASDLDGAPPRVYYLGLARWWRDPADMDWWSDLKRVRGAGSKGYRLLAEILVGITAENPKGISPGFSKYVKWFLGRRDHEEQFPMPATLLWNVAIRRGLRVEMPVRACDYLFEIPDSYWQTMATLNT